MTKDLVLAQLKRAEGYLSGERISAEIGVSRMAVSAAVKALRAEGYDISSATNRGYRLERSADRLSAGELTAYLGEERMRTVTCLDSVDSTNRVLREMAGCGAAQGSVVLAEEQTNGRGRRGRSFLSPKHKGIYLSYLLRPDSAPADTTQLTAWAAVAVARAVREVCGAEAEIKWVNDLLLNGKKFCGILTELSLEAESGHVDYAVVGIGVNVNEESADFPEALRETAMSLAQSTGRPQPRAELAAHIVRALDCMCIDWPEARAAYWEDYCRRSMVLGHPIWIRSPRLERQGTALSLNPDFSLHVRYDDGTEGDLLGGEISIVKQDLKL